MTSTRWRTVRPFWKWALLSPCLGILAYLCGAGLWAIIGERHAAKLVYLLSLVFAAPTLFTSLHAQAALDHTVPLKAHALYASVNVGIYLVFGILYGLKAEGYKFFRIAFWVLLICWVLLWMRYLG